MSATDSRWPARLPGGAGGQTEAAIATFGLTKRYGDTLALDGLALRIAVGEVYGFLGPNGAGKTTTIRLLLGVHRPTAGRAELFGTDAWGEPVLAHRRVAYVAGEPSLWPSMTAAETLEFLGRMHGSVDRDYRGELVRRFDLDTRKRIRALSKGNRQKVQLVAALATRADLLLLDEPTAGLDPLMEVAFRETVMEAKDRGQTVFLSSHILSEVEALCDRIGILRTGRLVDEGTLAELRHLSSQVVEATFDGPAPELAPIAGVSVVRVGTSALRFEVSGAIAPLITALGAERLIALESRAPSLEEIFLHHYAGTDGSRAPEDGGGDSERGGGNGAVGDDGAETADGRTSRTRGARFSAEGSLTGGSERSRSPYLFGIYAYIQPVGYRDAYKTLAERIGFARSFGDNTAIRLFYGEPHDLLTVSGYPPGGSGDARDRRRRLGCAGGGSAASGPRRTAAARSSSSRAPSRVRRSTSTPSSRSPFGGRSSGS